MQRKKKKIHFTNKAYKISPKKIFTLSFRAKKDTGNAARSRYPLILFVIQNPNQMMP